MTVEDHISHYPDSDLVDLLTGKKSIQEAVGLSAREVTRAVSAEGGSTD